ncbi:acyl-CoA thioesterase [Methylomonas sp. MgM2]
MIRAEVDVVVPFFDIDALGIVWHGHYAKYLEIARCALLDTIDYGYEVMRGTGYIWPIVDLQLRYVKPAKFEQRLKVYAELVEWEYRMKIKYRISDAASGEIMVKATTIQAAVDSGSGEMLYASPDIFLEKLRSGPGAS